MSNEPIGLKGQIDDINKKLDIMTQKGKKSKKKNFKLPFMVKTKLKKLAEKNMVLVMLLMRSKNIKPSIGEYKDGILYFEDRVFNGDPGFVWLYMGKYPCVILPEWDLNPISPSELYKEADQNKSMADAQRFIIRSAEIAQSMEKPFMNKKSLMWIILGGIVIAYLLFGGGV